MMVSIGTGVVLVNIAFSSSKSGALFERKKLQNTTFSTKLHQNTMRKIKTQVFTLSDVLGCESEHCADQRQHSIPDFLPKYNNITLQTCVDVANE